MTRFFVLFFSRGGPANQTPQDRALSLPFLVGRGTSPTKIDVLKKVGTILTGGPRNMGLNGFLSVSQPRDAQNGT